MVNVFIVLGEAESLEDRSFEVVVLRKSVFGAGPFGEKYVGVEVGRGLSAAHGAPRYGHFR